MEALADTSILIDLYRGHQPAMAWSQANPSLLLGITPMVYMEVILGAENKVAQNRVDAFLKNFVTVYLTVEDQAWAGEQFRSYRLSHNVGVVDCLIAAPAYRLQLPLYTRNLKHFTPLLGELAVQAY